MESDELNLKSVVGSEMYWVGIGSSAGGLESLRGFIHKLPTDLPATYIVAQHMAPHHRSLLSEIIGRETTMEVREVEDGISPLPNTIYITPPNNDVLVENDHIRLTAPSQKIAAPKPSVDELLKSLAVDKGARAIAVIFSGTGSDGAEGVRQIKDNGGIVIAQDEQTSKYPGMPMAAMETGCVDLVMSPEELGDSLGIILEDPTDLSRFKSMPLSESGIAELVRMLLEHTNVDFTEYKAGTIQRRVDRRIVATGTGNLEGYVVHARRNTEELDNLFNDLLITVTSFFRDTNEFVALQVYVEKIVEQKRRNKDDSIRVWVAGVATGEEAYTIAFLISEALGGIKSFVNANVQIFATDIDQKAIEVARRGFYAETSLVAIPENFVDTYFDAVPGGYTVRKVIREKIVFSIHNVFSDPPFLNLDLVSCRNLLIYFEASLQSTVFERFHYALRDSGVLFLGKSEAIVTSQSMFRPASPEKHIFIQRPNTKKKYFQGKRSLEMRRSAKLPKQDGSKDTVLRKTFDSVSSRFESLIFALGPNAMLLDSELNILKVYGVVDDFVGLSSNKSTSLSANSLLKEPWDQDVRVAVPSCLRTMKTYEGMTRNEALGNSNRQRIRVYPLDDVELNEQYALVVFHSWTDDLDITEVDFASSEDKAASKVIQELSDELANAKENLQTTVEELETTNEELQALNEELQSSNEELQSTNEELETSNEELQSTNEELSTVNEELQVNAQQLRLVNQNIKGVLDNIVTPTLLVDKHMRIVNASNSASKYFEIPVALEEPHISRCRLPEQYPDVESMLRKVIDSESQLETSFAVQGLNSKINITPIYTATDDLQGAIVQVIDNTEELRQVHELRQIIFDNSPFGIILRHLDGEILAVNRCYAEWNDTTVEDMIGKNMYDYYDEEAVAHAKEREADRIKGGNVDSDRFEVEVVHKRTGVKRLMRITRVPHFHAASKRQMMLSILEDKTGEIKRDNENERLRRRVDLKLASSSVGVWEHNFDTGESFWSSKTRELLGWSEAAVQGIEEFKSIFDVNDVSQLVASLAAAESGSAVDASINCRLNASPNKWLTISCGLVASGSGETVVGGTVADNTSILNRLFSLSEENRYLQLAEKVAESGYWSVNLETSQATWSNYTYELFGKDRSTFQPTPTSISDLLAPEDGLRVKSCILDAVSNRTEFDYSARVPKADSSSVYIKGAGMLEIRDGKPSEIFGVIRNVTEHWERTDELHKALEDLRRSNEELNRFSYVCSHDMKEPVRLIGSMSELLQEPDVLEDPDKVQNLLSRINTNTTRLALIIDNLLAYSRLDVSVENASIELNDVLTEVRSNLSLLLEERNGELYIGELPSLVGARVHFIQLFQNLISNALHYSDTDAPKVWVSCVASGRHHKIVIEDNGPGVPEESRGIIFDAFTRLTLNGEVEGSGLGLAICSRIVQQYGGHISCTSSVHGGAGFEILLDREAIGTGTSGPGIAHSDNRPAAE